MILGIEYGLLLNCFIYISKGSLNVLEFFKVMVVQNMRLLVMSSLLHQGILVKIIILLILKHLFMYLRYWIWSYTYWILIIF